MARAGQASSGGFQRFWRYNYRILVGTGYWVLVAPVAASQVVTLWMFALASGFNQEVATRIAEMMTPILGAFFVAHSLAPEYRSGVGAVLASKPVSLSRVLVMRVAVGMLAALTLSAVSLLICSLGLSPIDIGRPLLAAIPSLWFYASLALLFATILRNPIGGFAVTLGLWSLDFALGYGVHPLLSTQGYSTVLAGGDLAMFFLPGKGVQLLVGAILWSAHTRQLPRVCRPPERRDVIKIVAACALVLVIYCASGAGTVVGYAYVQRGNMRERDLVWLRRALQSYGPIPVPHLFGPAFAAYVADPPLRADGASAREVRMQGLQQALARWPNSKWADSIAFTLGFEQEGVDPPAAIRQYLQLADRFGDSPFAPKALGIVTRGDNAATDAERLLAARRLLADYPARREAEPAAEALSRYYPDRVKADELLAAAQKAGRVAPDFRAPDWTMRGAELEADMGRPQDARRHAQDAMAAARQLQERARSTIAGAMELTPHLGRIAGVLARGETLLKRLGR